MGRVELELVGDAVAREAWARVLDGAALLGRGRAHRGLARRGQWRSGASVFSVWSQVFDHGSGGHGSHLDASMGVLEAA